MAAPVDRRALGSWLEGPRAAAQADGVVFAPRGERLGLPAEGPGSIAPVGRRLLALVVDWLAASLLVLATGTHTSDRAYGWLVLAVFAVLTTALLATTGRSLGHAALRMQLVDARPRRLRPLRVLLRQLLLCLVVPAVVWDGDGRGMHDKAAGTVLVRS
ncbi:RDD family protein [Motilibacter peucedani]|uniref:RDD family protein n=1 Tax=Motilibacter peucedani TaxID=598650 RepID=A0A420XP76_9ACTN|nr:RDD family protein [Motilibacter peucedani]RKS74003.1 RDD family protein [Motilibacter peucedani]